MLANNNLTVEDMELLNQMLELKKVNIKGFNLVMKALNDLVELSKDNTKTEEERDIIRKEIFDNTIALNKVRI